MKKHYIWALVATMLTALVFVTYHQFKKYKDAKEDKAPPPTTDSEAPPATTDSEAPPATTEGETIGTGAENFQ